MSFIAKIFVIFVALEHLYILWLEMFAWTSAGKRVFRSALPAELFEATKGLAANQWLYNGFLAAGLLWSLWIDDTQWQRNIALFFLGCVAVAGIFGALRSAPKIFFLQALPALIAMALVWLG